jgi:hypothetical protein
MIYLPHIRYYTAAAWGRRRAGIDIYGFGQAFGSPAADWRREGMSGSDFGEDFHVDAYFIASIVMIASRL